MTVCDRSGTILIDALTHTTKPFLLVLRRCLILIERGDLNV